MDEAQGLHDALCNAGERLAGVLEGARFERRAGYALTSFPTFPLPSFNGVWAEDDSAAEALEAGLAELEETDIPLGVLSRRDTPAVAERARKLGLTHEERMPGMVATRDDLTEANIPELEVLKLETADGFAQALAIAAAGFEAPAELLAPIYMLEVAELGGIAIYLARVDGKDVSTAVHFVIDDAVGIFNVATPHEHRGHGYGAAVTAHAAQEGFAAGAEFAYLQSSSLGESVYKRLGFREVETYLLLTRPTKLSETS
jgi:predicted GNAT family acetyltransferase